MTWSVGTCTERPQLVQLQASVASALESCRIADPGFFFCNFSATFTSHSNLFVLLLKSPYFSNLSRPQKMIERPRSPYPRSTWILDHPRSHGLTTRTAKYIIITICLLLLRYYATIEWCGVFHSVARIRCGSRLVLGGGRAVEQHQSLDTTKAGNQPSRCWKLLGPSPG